MLTGTAAGHTPTGDILLKGTPHHRFDPTEYDVDATADEKVVWEHADNTSGGIVHNVHIEENPNGGTQLTSSGSLHHGDTYTVKFSLEDNGDTLRLTDENQSKTIDVTNAGASVELGVHCDFHAGQTEGGMNMDRFTVHL